MKIALVDDDPRALAQLEQYLTEQLGRETEISHYGSGEALLADWQPGAFELVVLDIYMGGATGMEVARRLRAGDGQGGWPSPPPATTSPARAMRWEPATICESPSGRRESGPCWSGWIWRRWSAPVGCGCRTAVRWCCGASATPPPTATG